MPEFSAVTEVIHRTDASAASLPWAEIRDRLASESYYKVEFKQPGSHNVVEVACYAIKETPVDSKEFYRVITTFEQSDISFKYGREKRGKPTKSWLREDQIHFPSATEAVMSAKIEALLYHAHTKGFKFDE